MTERGPPRRATAIPPDRTMQQHVERAIGALESYAHRDDVLFLWSGGKEANVIADLLLYAIGDESGVPPCPFGYIDTGYQFEEMTTFRDDWVSEGGVGPVAGLDEDHLRTRWHEPLLSVLDDPNDARWFHGEWRGGTVTKSVEGVPETPEEYTVETSCDLLKAVPYTEFVETDGFETVITGLRGDGVDRVMDRGTPTDHTQVNPLAGWDQPHVYAYIKSQSVALPVLYTEGGYTHTDTVCCTDAADDTESGDDIDREQLAALGYI